jgi:hypothetical protein
MKKILRTTRTNRICPTWVYSQCILTLLSQPWVGQLRARSSGRELFGLPSRAVVTGRAAWIHGTHESGQVCLSAEVFYVFNIYFRFDFRTASKLQTRSWRGDRKRSHLLLPSNWVKWLLIMCVPILTYHSILSHMLFNRMSNPEFLKLMCMAVLTYHLFGSHMWFDRYSYLETLRLLIRWSTMMNRMSNPEFLKLMCMAELTYHLFRSHIWFNRCSNLDNLRLLIRWSTMMTYHPLCILWFHLVYRDVFLWREEPEFLTFRYVPIGWFLHLGFFAHFDIRLKFVLTSEVTDSRKNFRGCWSGDVHCWHTT